MKPLAIVLGLHQNGLGVARALGRAGVPVIAVSSEPHDTYGQTRYARKVFCPDMRGMGLVETLEEIGRTLEQPGILIPTTDRSVLLLSQHRHRLEASFRHSLPHDDVIHGLMDKAQISRYATAHGFVIPRTFDIMSEDDLDACAAFVEFPCILKPRIKTVAFVRYTPQKAFLIRSREELRDKYRLISQWEATAVVQEWVPGPDTQLLFCLYYFDANGTPVASFTGRKLRQFIPYCGTAASAEPWDDPRVYQEGVRFFQAAGYRGFGAIEFKQDATGRYCLMEPTVGRTEHLFALAAANGINLPLIGYCDMAALPAPGSGRRGAAVTYVDWRRDWQAARFYRRAGELTLSDWLRSVTGRKQYALFAWDDPSPYLHLIGGRIGNRAHKSVGAVGNAARSLWNVLQRQARSSAAHSSRSREPQANAVHIHAALDWLCAAQEAGGGGVARGFDRPGQSRNAGWQAAYPETTGYIIPTFFDCARSYGRHDLRQRAIRMADWLVGVQTVEGAIPGGVVGQDRPPVVFNTGMVLSGWCRALKETGAPRYVSPIKRAVAFLTSAQDKDGAWRRFSNMSGELHAHAYDVLVSWPLLLASRALSDCRAHDAAIRNLDFTLTLQQSNGWYQSNALRPARDSRPLTHTIAYATEGLLQCGLLLEDRRYLNAARRTADALLARLEPNGYLAGEFDADWTPAARWCCLTGTAQVSRIWIAFHELTGDERYLRAARLANRFVKLTQDLHSTDAGVRGGIAGSHPVHGEYGRYQQLNWAAKYFIDALHADEHGVAVKATDAASVAGGLQASSTREWSAHASR